VLSRVFIVFHFSQLTSELKKMAVESVGSPQAEQLNYLVLMGTYGKEDAWCSRHQSRGHQAIPLTEETVKKIPMVARCLQQIGFDLKIILAQDRDHGLVLEGINQLYGVFHVDKALGSPFIPAQEGFVALYGVKSVIGSGTCLPAGVPMIYIGFASMTITNDISSAFSPLMSVFGRGLAEQFISERYFVA